MSSAAFVTSPLQACLTSCLCICQLAYTAKYNQQECRSLHAVSWNMKSYLEQLSHRDISAAGRKVLVEVEQTLKQAERLVTRVVHMGPLVSLLLAGDIRQKFLMLNRDLMNHFTMLGAGEQLSSSSSSHLKQLAESVRKLGSGFFAEQEAVSNRLLETAAVGQKRGGHPSLLHEALRDQLQQLPAVTSLTPDELVAELQALQLAAMYGVEVAAGEMGGNPHKGKPLGSKTEEFLVEQLCAALAPKAALSSQPLTPATAAPKVLPGFMCPIGLRPMANPVMLVETGQTYEAANINRWLQAHSTCPATGRHLTRDPQLMPNYNLKQSIEEWARENGVAVSAPTVPESPLLSVGLGAELGGTSTADGAAVGTAGGQVQSGQGRTAAGGDQGRSTSSSRAVQGSHSAGFNNRAANAFSRGSRTAHDAMPLVGITGSDPHDVELQERDNPNSRSSGKDVGRVAGVPAAIVVAVADDDDDAATGDGGGGPTPSRMHHMDLGSSKAHPPLKFRSRGIMKWRIVLLVLVVLVGVGAGVGIYFATKKPHNSDIADPVLAPPAGLSSPSPAPAPSPVALLPGEGAPGPIVVDVGRARFLFFKQALDWRLAEASCVKQGGHLASLTSAENEVVLKECATAVATDEVPGCWIGLNDIEKEGDYKWTDGRKFDYQDWYNYGNTQPGSFAQPDDGLQPDDEDCVFMYREYAGWHDRACSSKYYYVCKVMMS